MASYNMKNRRRLLPCDWFALYLFLNIIIILIYRPLYLLFFFFVPIDFAPNVHLTASVGRCSFCSKNTRKLT